MAATGVFLSTVLLSFAFSLAVAGLLGAYFGRGRSRSVGFVLTLVAVLLVGLFAALTWDLVPGLAPRFDPHVVGQSVIAVVAALIGTVLAAILFVTSVTRS